MADTYGVDAARLFVLSDSPPERDVQWTTAGVKAPGGCRPGLGRVRRPAAGGGDRGRPTKPTEGPRPAPRYPSDDQGGDRRDREVRFNSAIARLYELVGVWGPPGGNGGAAGRGPARGAGALARLIAPSPRTWPRSAGEGWARRPGGGVALAGLDPALAEDDERVLPVQINGKRRGEVRAPAGPRRRGGEDRA